MEVMEYRQSARKNLHPIENLERHVTSWPAGICMLEAESSTIVRQNYTLSIYFNSLNELKEHKATLDKIVQDPGLAAILTGR